MSFEKMDSTGQGQVSGQVTRRRPSIRRLFAYPTALSIALAAMALAVLPMHNSEAVINGDVVADAPSWSVYLEGPIGTCSGALIASNLVVTAGHCSGMTTATIGATDLGNIPPSGEDGLIRDIVAFEANPNGDDAAVYKLSSTVGYAAIPVSNEDIHLNPQTVTLFGYGRTTANASGSDLLIHSVNGMSAPCGSFNAAPSQFCLRSIRLDQSPCAGDSGAPIVTADGTLGAIHRSQLRNPGGTVCTGSNLWTSTSVTTESMRTWLISMINKYE